MRLLLAFSLAIVFAALPYPYFSRFFLFDTGMDPATHVSLFPGNLLAGALRGGMIQVQESRTLVTDRSSLCCVLAARILHGAGAARYESLSLKVIVGHVKGIMPNIFLRFMRHFHPANCYSGN